MNEELNFNLPEDKDFETKQEYYNSWLENNELSHWECTDNLGMFFIRYDDKEYFNESFNPLKKVSKSIIERLKEFDRINPIKPDREEAFA